jgi:hypothetical protein
MERYVNCAASVMSFSKGRLAEEVADRIAAGEGLNPPDVFDKGKAFVRENMNRDRVRDAFIAMDTLRKVGLAPPPRLFYPNQPETVLAEAVSSDPNLVSLKEATKVSDTKKMIVGMKRMKITVRISDSARLVYALDWSLGTPLKPVVDSIMTVFPFHDVAADRVQRYLDVSPGRDEARVSVVDLFSDITRTSNILFSAEQLFSYITQPLMLADQRYMLNGLIALGVEGSVAASIVLKIQQNGSLFGLKDIASGYSLASPTLTECNRSRATHDRWVVKPSLANQTIEDVISDMGLLFAISELTRTGEAKRVVVSQLYNTAYEVKKMLEGKNFNTLDHAWSYIPRNERVAL